MGQIILATDSFDRVNANPISGTWTTVTGNTAFQIVSNAATPSDVNSDAMSYYSGITWPADQWAQITRTAETGAPPSDTGIGVAVRCSAAANTFYRLVVSSANVAYLHKFVAGVFTQLWSRSPATGVNPNVFRLEIFGSTLRAFCNGVPIGATTTDTAITSGSAGIAFSSPETTATADDWSGGTFFTPIKNALDPAPFKPGLFR